MSEIDTGDHVLHGPTGETWLVAYLAADKLVSCGWPETMALVTDCTLIKKCTDQARNELLLSMSKMNPRDSRASYALHRLNEERVGGIYGTS